MKHEIIVDPSAYSEAFYEPLISWARYLILMGGRGGSKTDVLYLKYLLELFQPYFFRLGYINKEKSNIRDQQYAGFKRVAKRTGLDSKLKFYDGDYRIVCPSTENYAIPKGMDDPEKTKGLDEITTIWWDEINKGTLDDFLTLNALLRSPEAKYLQFAMSFNPVSENHWLRHQFFDKKDAYVLNEAYSLDGYLHHSTYLDNDFIDKEEYRKTLELNANGNQNRLLVDIKGLWGVTDNKNPFFYAYKHDQHFTHDKYQLPENQIIYLSFDFNKMPVSLLVGIVYNGEISIIDLIATDENTIPGFSPLEAACMRFNQKYIDSGLVLPAYLVVTGDASGTHGSADNVANKNFYSKIREMLHISESQIRIRKKNLEHVISQEICNGCIYHTNFKIYKSAERLTFDVQSAQILNEKLVKSKEDGQHFTDALRYWIDCVLGFDQWKDYIRFYGRKTA